MVRVSVLRPRRGLMSPRDVRLPRLGVRRVHNVRPGRRWRKIAKCVRSEGPHHPTAWNERTTDFCRARGGSQTAPLTPWTGCSGKTGTERSRAARMPHSRKTAEGPPIEMSEYDETRATA